MARRFVWLMVFAVTAWMPRAAAAQERQVTGTVTQVNSTEPIYGATVLQGSNLIGRSDDHGNFRLSLPEGAQQITVRAIGYLPRVVTVAPDASTITVTLAPDVLKLETQVVTGVATGITRKEAPTSTELVSAPELVRAPAMTVDQALQGKVAGANIQTNSGAPGGGVQVQIRGVNTATGGSDPLFVVDGIIYSNQTVPTGLFQATGSGANNGTGPAQDDAVNRLADLNPGDIESIEVLKSAAASSIYGSKAANGVVVITTKKGKSGKPHYDITQRAGFSHLLRGAEERAWTVAAADSAYGAATVAPFIVNGKLPVYDHLREVAGQTPLNLETLLGISGGTDNTRYYLSGGLTQDNGIISATGADRQTLRANVNQHLGKRLEGQFTGAFTHSTEDRGFINNDNNGASTVYGIAYIPSFIPITPDAAGVFPQPAIAYKGANPLQTIAISQNQNLVNRFTGGGRANYDAFSTEHNSLQLIAAGGLDYFNDQSRVVVPRSAYFEANQSQPGVSVLGTGDNRYYNWNLNAIHTLTPGGGAFKATTSAGVSFEDREFNIASTAAFGLVGDQRNINAGSSVQNNQTDSHERTLALYGQEQITTLGDHLLIELGLRSERSSNNGSTAAYETYPKAAASYQFPNLFGRGSTLKLRSAYGETGNQPLFGQKYTLLNATNVIAGNVGTELGTQAYAADPAIKPERTREVEGGFDASGWDGRADLELTLYHRRTSGLILPRTPAPSSGYFAVYKNGGTFQNEGIEIGGTVIPIQARRFTWTFQTTFNSLRNRVESLPFPSFRPATAGFGLAFGEFLVQPGRPISQIIGQVPNGSGGFNVVYLGQVNPEYRWSFINTFSRGGWSLTGLLDWQKGGVAENQTLSLYDCNNLAADDGTPAGHARFLACNSTQNATPFVQNTTFLKLRELKLAYDFPVRFAKVLFGASSLQLSASGRNLLLITNYFGYDPEVSNFGEQAITRGVDLAPYPPSRSFYFTINAGF